MALIITMLITWAIMWVFFKFMYPKPPEKFFPKEGDIITLRQCDHCGHSLAQYRGIVEKKPTANMADIDNVDNDVVNDAEAQNISTVDNNSDTMNATNSENIENVSNIKIEQLEAKQKNLFSKMLTNKEPPQQPIIVDDEWFFCNADHQASFHGVSLADTDVEQSG